MSPSRAFGRDFLARSSPACRRTILGPGSKASENRCSLSSCHRSASDLFGCRSLACCHGSCLLSLKLRFLSQADDFPFEASRSSDLIVRPWSSPVPRRLPGGARNPRRSVPFSHPGCDTGPFGGRFCLSKTAGWQTTTLAHSSNYRLRTDCVRPAVRNRGRGGVTRLCGWFLSIRATCFSCQRVETARRLTS
jgi:hypothetical protein